MREGRIRAPYSPNLTSHIGKWRSHTIREWTSQSHDSSYRIWWLVYSLHTILENPTTREDDEEEAKTWRKKRTKLCTPQNDFLRECKNQWRRMKMIRWRVSMSFRARCVLGRKSEIEQRRSEWHLAWWLVIIRGREVSRKFGETKAFCLVRGYLYCR